MFKKQAPGNNNIDIMYTKAGQQQIENLNLITQNLANLANPVTDA